MLRDMHLNWERHFKEQSYIGLTYNWFYGVIPQMTPAQQISKTFYNTEREYKEKHYNILLFTRNGENHLLFTKITHEWKRRWITYMFLVSRDIQIERDYIFHYHTLMNHQKERILIMNLAHNKRQVF